MGKYRQKNAFAIDLPHLVLTNKGGVRFILPPNVFWAERVIMDIRMIKVRKGHFWLKIII